MARATNAPAVCGVCHNPIDREAVLRAIRNGERYVHGCGKVLHRGAA